MNQYHKEMGALFSKAEPELRAVADKHGFSLRLTEQREVWYFYPEVPEHWEPEPRPRPDNIIPFPVKRN